MEVKIGKEMVNLEPDPNLKANITDFIGIYDDAVPAEFCQRMIDTADNSHFVQTRQTFGIQDRQLVLDSFHAQDVGALYRNALEPCLKHYIATFPYLSSFNYVSSAALLQITQPRGGGYHMFHAENIDWNVNDRVLAWMIYLNDVDAGETEFLYQGIRVRPKTGRVVLWPASFTHLHRGNPPANVKYIITGWWQGVNGLRVTDTAGSQEHVTTDYQE